METKIGFPGTWNFIEAKKLIEQNRVIAEASNACPVVFLGAFGRYLWAQPANVRPVEKKIAGYAWVLTILDFSSVLIFLKTKPFLDAHALTCDRSDF